jgi:DNA adenine methylase
MKAPIGRMGGKSKLKLRLIEMFPKDYDTFVEPFVGAGNIFYSTPKVENEIINDKDKDMYIIHKGLQQNAEYIDKNIPREKSRSRFEKSKDKNDVISILYRYKSSFMSHGKSYDTGSKDQIQTDFSVYGPRLKGVKILNQDYSTVIKKYDSPKTFFYLDPPYESSTGKEGVSDYKDFVSPDDVYKSLQGLKGKFMLSYNDSANIRKIFGRYNIRKIKTKYTGIGKEGGTRRPATELIITNY